jgi:uncharacterized membrane protein YesL
MQEIFGIHGTAYRIMEKVSDTLILTLLWTICSIPILTIGASTTALYYVALKIAKGEEGNITRQFFSSFRNNLKQATILWGIFIVIGLILGSNYLYYWVMGNQAGRLLQKLFLLLLILYGMTLTFLFPVLSKFDNSIKDTIIFSLMMSIRNIAWTVALVFVDIFIVNVILVFNGFPIIMSVGAIACLQSYIFNRIFNGYIRKHRIEKII